MTDGNWEPWSMLVHMCRKMDYARKIGSPLKMNGFERTVPYQSINELVNNTYPLGAIPGEAWKQFVVDLALHRRGN